MPTEPETPTLAQIVNAAVDVADPHGGDDAVAEFQARFEDRDEPVTAVADVEEQLIEAARAIDLDGDSRALDIAVKVATYLAFRRDLLGNTGAEEIIRLAEKAESDR
jgi:hypothetical protein